MTIKVFISTRKTEIIQTEKFKNFCQIHEYLNKKFGLKGWDGYEILK